MIISYLRTIRKIRVAARNYRILSALDDDALHDLGMDRRTLRAFCDNGCSHTAVLAVSEPVDSLAVLLPPTLKPAHQYPS